MSQKPDIGQDASVERGGELIFVQCSKIELVFMKCQMDTEERTHIFFKYRNVLKKTDKSTLRVLYKEFLWSAVVVSLCYRGGGNTQKSYFPCVTFCLR